MCVFISLVLLYTRLRCIVINLFRWIPESARWLLGQGRNEEAKKIIRRVAAINKKKIPENLLEEVGQIQCRYIISDETFNKTLAILSQCKEFSEALLWQSGALAQC